MKIPDCIRAVVLWPLSPLLSVRTMEDWLQGRRTPPDWTHAYIISAVSRAAARKTRRRVANRSAEQRPAPRP